MNKDFHFFATYTAARLAGFTIDEAYVVGAASQFTDMCTKTFLDATGGPVSAATTQVNAELIKVRMDVVGRQDITRIWSSFHFLPYDLYAKAPWGNKNYQDKYALICAPNGPLVQEIVKLAHGKGLEAAGICCHTLADTWAHAFFAGTPSLAINNVTSADCYELIDQDGQTIERPVRFLHRPTMSDNLKEGTYVQSVFAPEEHSIMNLGHGRCGHLPDYSFIRYRYLSAWGDYKATIKDNQKDFYLAISQMAHALRYLHGDVETFELNTYEDELLAPYEIELRALLAKRQLDAAADWKRLTERIFGEAPPAFEHDHVQREYVAADKKAKPKTELGRYFHHAMSQKSLVTNRIWKSGNRLAGRSIEMGEGIKGVIEDYLALIQAEVKDRD
jgi:hypothetical protein